MLIFGGVCKHCIVYLWVPVWDNGFMCLDCDFVDHYHQSCSLLYSERRSGSNIHMCSMEGRTLCLRKLCFFRESEVLTWKCSEGTLFLDKSDKQTADWLARASWRWDKIKHECLIYSNIIKIDDRWKSENPSKWICHCNLHHSNDLQRFTIITISFLCRFIGKCINYITQKLYDSDSKYTRWNITL